ncbi:MAG: hypothetical protein M8467_03880 [Anaerolineae bacterium]|nr:hypothetical protein [Anaerolineae bacterium]
MTEEPGTIQLGHSKQIVYFASQGQGMSLLDVGIVIDLIGVSAGQLDEQTPSHPEKPPLGTKLTPAAIFAIMNAYSHTYGG